MDSNNHFDYIKNILISVLLSRFLFLTIFTPCEHKNYIDNIYLNQEKSWSMEVQIKQEGKTTVSLSLPLIFHVI